MCCTRRFVRSSVGDNWWRTCSGTQFPGCTDHASILISDINISQGRCMKQRRIAGLWSQSGHRGCVGRKSPDGGLEAGYIHKQFVVSNAFLRRFVDRGGSTLGQGADSKASWPFWRDYWGPKMLQNPNFPRWGTYSAPAEPLADG